MVAPYPPVDGRRAKELLAELEQMAAGFLPAWHGATLEGDAGHALLRIAARLAEQVTYRLGQTPRRDAIAFFDTLDLPPDVPQPAEAPLVFVLAEKRDTPVYAPARIQVAAKGQNGTEVIFETRDAIVLTPARLSFVAAVDTGTDRIEEAPPKFLELVPPVGVPPQYVLATFAGVKSNAVQITPAIGLEKDDWVRIQGLVYQLKEGKNGLFTLVDPLDVKADPGTTVEKVTNFETFSLRNRQAHLVYLGHAELFNLEQPSTIDLKITSAEVARQLVAIGVQFQLYGTPATKATDWHDVKLVGTVGDELQLNKDWEGSVEQYKVHGHQSRWLRMRLPGAIPNDPSINMRVSRLTLKVKSDSPVPGSNEGSPKKTLKQAFYNGTPLPLTTRFYPFGAEPRRFDTFALAAPEALTKKGAKVTLDITLVDASPASLTLPLTRSGITRAYAIGNNGRLQVLALNNGTVERWQELDYPRELPGGAASGAGSQDPISLRLDGGFAPEAVEYNQNGQIDLIVVRDCGGRFWTTNVYKRRMDLDNFEHTMWKNLPALNNVVSSGTVLFLNPKPDQSPQSIATLVVITSDRLSLIDFASNGEALGEWHQLTSNSQDKPQFGSQVQLCPIITPTWPVPPLEFPLGLVLLDDNGVLWRIEIDRISASVVWKKLAPESVPAASSKVRPVAAISGDNRLVVYAATIDQHQLFAVFEDQWVKPVYGGMDAFKVDSDTKLLCVPIYRDHNFGSDRLLVVAFGKDFSSNPEGNQKIALWTDADPDWLELAELLAGTTAIGFSSGILIPVGGASAEPPKLIFNGGRETLYTTTLTHRSRIVKYELFDTVILEGEYSAHYVELIPGNQNARRLMWKLDQNPAIKESEKEKIVRAYNLPLKKLKRMKTFQFYRHRLPDNKEKFTGTRVEDQKNQLTLDAEDEVTINGDYLLIEEKTYEVENINENRIATLKSNLPDTQVSEVDYIQIYSLEKDPLEIQENQKGTLLYLSEEKKKVYPALMRFNISTQSIEKKVRLADYHPIGKLPGAWILLQDKWDEPPDDKGTADLVVGFTTGSSATFSFERNYQNPELAWEYFDGSSWRRLETNFQDGTNHLAVSNALSFQVPENIAPTEIAGSQDYWIRARLIGGDYGRAKYIATTDGYPPKTTQTITIDTSGLNPPEILRIEASFTLDDERAPEQVLTENNLAVLDQTQANRVDSAQYELFEGAGAISRDTDVPPPPRALYFGFTKPFDVRPLTLLVDAEELPAESELRFEVLAQDRWRLVSVDKDETHGFHRSGLVHVIVDVKPRRASLFGQELFWLRAFSKANPTQWAPRLRGVFLNSGIAQQAKSVKQEIVGSSLGQPDLRVLLSQVPILPASLELRVRETLSEDEREALTSANPNEEVVAGYANIPGSWVLWKRVDSFIDADGDARVYRLDPATGEVRFGDGRQGRIPPAGRDAIRAIRYQSGGGSRGNVDAFTIDGLKSAIEAVEGVNNPIRASGGVDAPGVDALIATAPSRLRHEEQALTPVDIEAMAVAWSPGIVRARCLVPTEPDEHIKVVIAQRSDERCPQPSLADSAALARFIRERAWGALDERGIEVTGPRYTRLEVDVSLLAVSPEQSAALDTAANERLRGLFHPTQGGPDGTGWPFGRRPWQSDVLRAVADLPGLDRVESVQFKPEEGISGDALSSTTLIYAEEGDIRVTVRSTGEGD